MGQSGNKWFYSNEVFYDYMDKLGNYFESEVSSGNMETRDIPSTVLETLGSYVGDATLGKVLCRYELYKKVINLAGDIGEIGIFRGNSFMQWVKMVQLFEPYNNTKVYGFDWFQGMNPDEMDDENQAGKYCADYQHLMNLIEWQKLDHIAIVEKMDVSKEMERYVSERPWLRFKLLYIDCGIRDVMEASYRFLYPRLVRGGVLLMDHFNSHTSPSESDIIDKYVEGNIVRQMPFARQPTGYIVKE